MAGGVIDGLARRFLSPFAYDRWLDFRGELNAMSVHRKGVRAARGWQWKKGIRLNIGCGPVQTPGYVRVDFCPGVDIRVDLRRALPIPDGVASVILCEHFLEHLRYPGQTLSFLRECRRMLAPNGRLLLSVPDTRWPMECYVHGSTEWQDICKENKWHPDWVETTMEHLNYHFRQQGDGRRDGHFECHRFAYDAETLGKALKRAGFSEVGERPYEEGLDAPHRRVGSLFMFGAK